MIDYLIFNEELDAIIKQLQHSKDPKVKLARLMIIGTMQKYEKRVSAFESDMAPKDKFSTEINQVADSVSQIAWLSVKILV